MPLSNASARGQDGSLRLSCMTLSFTAQRRFIPTLSSPGGILAGDALNEATKIGGNSWPARASAGKKAPIEAKPGTMPAHDRLRFNHDQHLCPPRPQPPKRYPEQAIPPIQRGAGVLPLEHA